MRNTVISPLNAWHFLDLEDVLGEGQNIDTQLQHKLVRTWEHRAFYALPVERSDKFRFQYSSTDSAARSLWVCDMQDRQVLEITETATVDIPGNLDGADQLHSYLYRLANYNVLTADGDYYLKLTVQYDLAHTDIFVSEPFRLRDSHPNTIALDYSHSANKGDRDMYFVSLSQKHRIRVHGIIADFQPLSADTVYEDQEHNLVPLDSQAYEGWKLRVGGNGTGIADWLLRKLNEIFTCDTLFVGKTQYVKADGAKWEVVRDANNPLSGASIDLRLADNTAGFTHGTNTILLYFEPSFPYAVSGIYLGPNNGVRVGGAYVLDNSTERNTMLTALNAALGATEFTGTIVNSGGFIEYELGDGETVSTATAIVYSILAIGFNVTAGGALVNPTATFTIEKGHAVVDWGHGSAVNADANLTPVSYSHVYPTLTAATYTARIFANSDLGFSMDAGPVLTVDTLTGAFTPDLAKLTLAHFGLASNQLDFAIFANSPLLELSVTSSGLTTINNLAFATGTSAANPQPYLRMINLSSNAFTTSTATNVLRQVLANVTNYNIIGGDLYMVQSPSLTFGFAGGLLISGLASKGWFVHL